MQNEIFERLKEKISSENIKYNETMSKHTSFKVGGNADIFVTINTKEEMLEILKINQSKLPIMIVGNGTNLLVKDSGIRGIVVKYTDDKIENINENTLKVSAGISNAKLANYLLRNNLSGFEFAAGIPRNTRRSNIYERRCIWWRNKRHCKKCYIS